MSWTTISTPKALVEQIEKIYAALGYKSISEFTREAIRRHLVKEQRRFDEIEQERAVGRKVLGKDDEGEL